MSSTSHHQVSLTDALPVIMARISPLSGIPLGQHMKVLLDSLSCVTKAFLQRLRSPQHAENNNGGDSSMVSGGKV